MAAMNATDTTPATETARYLLVFASGKAFYTTAKDEVDARQQATDYAKANGTGIKRICK